jgi:hypothetical protein
MSDDWIRGYLQVGFFVGGCGLLMLFLQRPGSGEFVLSLCSAIMGLGLVAGVIAFKRWAMRRGISNEDVDE